MSGARFAFFKTAFSGVLLLAASFQAAAATVPFVSFEAGPEMETYNYHEEGALNNEGGLFGGYMAIKAEPSQRISFQFFGSVAGGNLRYEGKSFDDRPLKYDVPSFLANTRATMALPIPAGPITITPFCGIAMRYLDEDFEHNHQNGYQRETTQFYSPLGMALSVTNTTWTYGLQAEYDLFWTGANRNRDIPLEKGGSRNVTLRQDTGYGIQGSLFAQRQITKIFTLTIEPFLSYWDVSASDEETIWMRDDYPYDFQRKANQTWMCGLRIGLAW